MPAAAWIVRLLPAAVATRPWITRRFRRYMAGALVRPVIGMAPDADVILAYRSASACGDMRSGDKTRKVASDKSIEAPEKAEVIPLGNQIKCCAGFAGEATDMLQKIVVPVDGSENSL